MSNHISVEVIGKYPFHQFVRRSIIPVEGPATHAVRIDPEEDLMDRVCRPISAIRAGCIAHTKIRKEGSNKNNVRIALERVVEVEPEIPLKDPEDLIYTPAEEYVKYMAGAEPGQKVERAIGIVNSLLKLGETEILPLIECLTRRGVPLNKLILASNNPSPIQ